MATQTSQSAYATAHPASPILSTGGPYSTNIIACPLTNYEQHARRDSVAERLFTLIEILSDLLCVLLSFVLATVISGASTNLGVLEGAAVGLAVAGVLVMVLARDGVYAPGSSLLRVRETERILRGWCQVLLLFSPACLFLYGRYIACVLLVIFMVPMLLILEKNLVYFGICKLRANGYAVRNAVIYGAGMTGRRIFSTLTRSPKLGVRPVLFVDDDPAKSDCTIYECSYQRRKFARVLAGPVTTELLTSVDSKLLIIGIPTISQEKLAAACAAADAAGCMLCLAPHDFAPGCFPLQRADVDGTLLVIFEAAAPRHDLLKRMTDVLLSAVLLVFASPIFAVVSGLICLTSRGPALFCQERVGKDGELFRMYKFRSMYVDTPAYDYSPRNVADRRITKVGRFLRLTSLDELPQIINVLKGDMSLVGPRPEMPFIVEEYSDVHRQRLRVKPGITGLWQLSADRAYRIHENLEYDLYYIRNRTFFMDIAVLLHTAVFAARGI